MHIKETVQVGETSFTFETGKMARQADGAVVVTCGETVVIATACASDTPRAGVDFLPLSVDYIEKSYAAGRVPGNFFRREARPSTEEILVSRMIDRPIRPLFPKTFRNELQVLAFVLSMDKENDPSIAAMNGASAALMISSIPFAGPVGAVRVARIDGQLLVNPTFEQQEASSLDLIVSAGRDGIVMVEGDADFISEKELIDALLFAEEQIQPILKFQEDLREKVGKTKRVVEEITIDEELYAAVQNTLGSRLDEAVRVKEKQSRRQTQDELRAAVIAELDNEEGERAGEIGGYFDKLLKKTVRQMIISDKVRIDGRDYETVRGIDTEVGILPRTHGSSLFTRGETQALVTATLGMSADEQRIETLMGQEFRRFLLHYNFPPFCTGEAKFLRGTSRRELGHGTLARRGVLRAVDMEDFPYTVRVVSEVLESNGSSSMATVCGASLALMNAGVPMKAAVAGIAMGLIKEGDDIAVLTDILGDEDHLGDMDFKVVGSSEGITALQMDCKITGLDRDTLTQALSQARDARLHILGKMGETITDTAEDISEFAPRIFTLLINPDRIRDLIGPGGKHIRGIQADTDTKVEVDDEGAVKVAALDDASAQKAIELIRSYTAEPEIGETYLGRVVKVVDFGAFVRILPGTDGLVHISELAHRRVNRVEDVLREGDEVMVKVIGLDRGKIKLSRKAALTEEEAAAEDVKSGTDD